MNRLKLCLVLSLALSSCAWLIKNNKSHLVMSKSDSLVLAQKNIIGQPMFIDTAVVNKLLSDLAYTYPDSSFALTIKYKDLKALIIKAVYDGTSFCAMGTIRSDSIIRAYFTPNPLYKDLKLPGLE